MTESRIGPPYGWYRSYLYVPAIDARRIERALASAADALVLDLEDAVPADRKDEARAAARALVSRSLAKPVFVRVNSAASGLLDDDLEAVACAGLAGIRLPKAESADHVIAVCAQLRLRGCDVPVVPIIESALGVERALEIAAADPAVTALAMGEADLGLDLGTTAEGVLDYARARCVVASAAARISGPIQSVCTQLDDEQILIESTRRGRAMGFSGRSAIHPRQLAIINDIFTPSEDERRWAQEVLEAARQAHAEGRAVAVTRSGELVDRPIRLRAAAILGFSAWGLPVPGATSPERSDAPRG